MSNAVLEIRELEKEFGERCLFRIKHFLIQPSTAYVMSGPNGAGKSTLLRILAGLEPASVGSALYQGQAVSLYPASPILRRQIVYMHQHPVMFDRSLAGNVAYGLQGTGLSRQEIHARVEEAISWAGIAHLNQLPARSLSGGEKQRVALARARVLRPKILLLDEPTASLDGAAREHVMRLIPQLVSDGCSLVIASHERDLMNLAGATRIRLEAQQLTLQCGQGSQAALAS